MTYKEISEKFFESKENPNKEEVKRKLISFVLELESIVNSLKKHELTDNLPFSDFIEDNNYIFGIDNFTISNNDKADINISTKGLLAELLEICEIPNGTKLANDLKQAIFNLHGKLSREISEVDNEISSLNRALENIKKVLG